MPKPLTLLLISCLIWSLSNCQPSPPAERTATPLAKITPPDLPRPQHPLAEEAVYAPIPLLPRDAIAPIYTPRFISAHETDYPDDKLVLGVSLNGEARAYAVGILNRREMVNDTVGSIPILVTW